LREGRTPLTFQEELAPHQKLTEDIMLRLRTEEGVKTSYLLAQYKREEVESKLKCLEFLSKEGFIIKEEERFYLSQKECWWLIKYFKKFLIEEGSCVIVNYDTN